jgi:hypothetical protein
MPEDTQDSSDRPPYKEAMLTLLRMADERMLQESGNPVYLKLINEINRFR